MGSLLRLLPMVAIAMAFFSDGTGVCYAKRCQVKAIFNFGDSNSDTGGFYAAFPAPVAPFGMTFFKKPTGRASDGRLVVDFLAQALGLPLLSPYLQSMGSNFKHGANFATLASTVLLPNTSLFVSGISPFSLAIQLNQMKQFHAKVVNQIHRSGNLPHRDVFGKSLYTIDIGQNDFTSNLATIGEGVQQYLPQVVDQIASTIHELYALGGRIFLVFNLAPVGCFPYFLASSPHIDSYGCFANYNNAVLKYNSMLRKKLHEVHSLLADAHVVYIDTSSLKLDLFRNPQKHGFKHGIKACCGHGGGIYNCDPKVLCGNSKVIDGRKVAATACEDPHNHVSWDGIHTTEAANRLLAEAVLNGSYSDPPFPFSDLCPKSSFNLSDIFF